MKNAHKSENRTCFFEGATLLASISKLAHTAGGFLVALISGFALVACDPQGESGGPEAKDGRLVELAASVSQKVVNIEVTGVDSKERRTGTGFFVSLDGKVATCAHLIEGASLIRVKTLTGAEFSFEGVVSVDAEKDLALLSVSAEGVPSFEPRKSPVSVGTPVVVFGNPLGLKGSLADGVVSAIRGGGEDTKLLQISVPVSPGSSGSPVFALSGELVGMVGARARGGEGVGFALPADYIWKAVDEIAKGKVDEGPQREALALSRKRYLPSPDLWADSEWNNGELPDATSQRLAVLRRLKLKYPKDAILRVEIAKALQSDGNYEQAFEECTALIDEDPGNRLAVSELISVISKEERKLPYVKAALSADPLNFRARRYLFEQEGSDDDFLSAQLSARRALETAPFALRIAEGYTESLLDNQMHDIAVRERLFEPIHAKFILKSIEEANQLRRLIWSAGMMVSEPGEDILDRFLELANEAPEKAFPYAWEIAQLQNEGREDVKSVLSGEAGDRLREFIKGTALGQPLVAEAYLLDFAAVDVGNGLLIDAFWNAYLDLMSLGGVERPFDQLGMVLLLADASGHPESERSGQGPDQIVQWIAALEEHAATTKDLGGILPKISNRGSGKWSDPLIFRFWLAAQKERFEEAIGEGGVGEEEKTKLERALKALKETPSKLEAAEAIRAETRERSFSLWEYFGDEYRRPLEQAFEAAVSE